MTRLLKVGRPRFDLAEQLPAPFDGNGNSLGDIWWAGDRLRPHLRAESADLPRQRVADPHGSEASSITRPSWDGRRAAREDRVYVPQHALELPNDITSDDIEIATGDVWPSRKKQIPQKALEPNNLDDHASMRTNR